MTHLRWLAALAAVVGALPALAALERVGPNNPAPSVGSYPAWYQDRTGVVLEFCDPKSQAELDGGWCLVLPANVPAVPEVFPTNFFDEHFYFSAGANLTPLPVNGKTNKATLTLALEGAFATGPAIPGNQIAFARIRVKLNIAPVSGTYRIIHPYGEEVFQGVVAGDRIFFTDDVGINCPPGQFDCALSSRLGPFLMASASPGGPELPAVTGPVPGKLYVADPARLGPVTGSTLPDFVNSQGVLENHNVFRIEGPPGSALGGIGQDWIETSDFTLQGRLFTSALPGLVTVERASYERNGAFQKLDVLATGLPTTQGRLPANAPPAAVLPQLGFFEAPCELNAATGALVAPTGFSEVPLVNAGSAFWGQTQPAVVPTAVCVKDASARNAAGQVVPAFTQKTVTDEVTITEALFDRSKSQLSVKAASSDALSPPILTVATYGEIPAGSDQLLVTPLAAPVARVRVLSSAGGIAEVATRTVLATLTPPLTPTAVNDAFTFNEDSGPQALDLLGNDLNAVGGTLTLVSQPGLGTAALRPDGRVDYTPNPNAFGQDGFSYTVTAGGLTSNVGSVSITLTPVNDPPVAVADGPFAAALNVPVDLPSLLANDTDPDGAADLVGVQIVAQPQAGAVITGVSPRGVVTFLATVAGTYTFTYRAVDASGTPSLLPATVTVNAVAADAVSVTSALFRTGTKRWAVTGSETLPDLTLTLSYLDGQLAGQIIGTVTAVGTAWTFDIRGVTGPQDPTTLNPRPTRIRVTSTLGGTVTQVIVYRN